MASIKVKFRASEIEGKEGVIYYQIIHKRVVRQINTQYKITRSEWDLYSLQGDETRGGDSRALYLDSVRESVKLDMQRLSNIVGGLKRGGEYSASDVVSSFGRELQGVTLFEFMQSTIYRLGELHRYRTSQTYATTLNSFMRFRGGKDLLLTDISSDMMMDYESYLKREGIMMNSISFYMRILRALYNRAVEVELVEQRFPFRKVYTGIDKTVKRALSLQQIKQIKELDLSSNPKMSFARDIFMLSFYCRGMSFVDMAFLRKSDLRGGVLSYRRRKTGQQLHIKWEESMQKILSGYPLNKTEYLFPIITKDGVDRGCRYNNELAKINCQLKRLSTLLSLPMPLTMYVARHSWASIAKSQNIPISVISEGMGHDSEATTQIYLASLDTAVVDRANSMIIGLL